MRRIDRWVGVPLCAALTALRGRRDPEWTGPPERILLVKLAEQGATVVAHPALQRAVDLVGRDRVHVAVFAENRAILDELDVVDPANVIAVRSDGPVRTIVDLVRMLVRCRRLGVDTVVDLEWFSRVSAVIAALSGARIRSGLHAAHGEGPYRGDLLTHRVLYNPHRHAAEVYEVLVAVTATAPDLLPAIPADVTDRATPVPLPRVGPTTDETASLVELLPALGDATQRVVLLNANAGDLLPLRRWPDDRYVELARRLLDAHDDVTVAFTGAPSEAAAIGPVAARVGSDRCVDLSGRTTLRQLLVLMQLADVLVTNDSGPGHFSALTDIDAITLFGPETPTVFGPVGPHSSAIWLGLPCSPCVNALNDRQSSCRDNVCMTGVSTDTVLAAVEERLARRLTRSDNRSS